MDKEWEHLTRYRQMTKVRNKIKVIAEARNECRTVLFASSMDGRVVLRDYNIKDDSGSYAVFTKQGLSACKSNGCHIKTIRMRRTSSRRTIGLHPGKNGRCTDVVKQFQSQNVQIFGHVSTIPQMAKIMVQHGRPSRSS